MVTFVLFGDFPLAQGVVFLKVIDFCALIAFLSLPLFNFLEQVSENTVWIFIVFVKDMVSPTLTPFLYMATGRSYSLFTNPLPCPTTVFVRTTIYCGLFQNMQILFSSNIAKVRTRMFTKVSITCFDKRISLAERCWWTLLKKVLLIENVNVKRGGMMVELFRRWLPLTEKLHLTRSDDFEKKHARLNISRNPFMLVTCWLKTRKIHHFPEQDRHIGAGCNGLSRYAGERTRNSATDYVYSPIAL